MAGPNVPHEPEEEQPLDPAAERVRRKLVRFMGINFAILFTAVMAVVLAFVYKSLNTGEVETVRQGSFSSGSPVPAGEMLTGDIALPADSSIVSHSISGSHLTLHLEFADGSEAIHLYDVSEARPIGRFQVVREGQ